MAPAPTAAPTMLDGAAPADDADAASAPASDDTGGSDEQVLLTVTKHADGTYCLYKGDEPEGGDEDDGAAGEGDEGAGAAGDQGDEQTFDSVGALLKGVLDLLNEDKASAGAPGSADDQFQAGFDESAPAKPASQIPQKY